MSVSGPMPKVGMPIGLRMALTMVGGFVVTVALVSALIWQTILPGFERLEREAALRNVDRVQRAVTKEAETLSTLVRDWASWDDTYQFVIDGNARYRDSNLVDTTFSNMDLGVVFILDNDGKVIWSRSLDPETMAPLTLSAFPSEAFSPDHFLLTPNDTPSGDAGKRGLVSTEHGPMIVATRPILDSDETAPRRGTFIMGRFLNQPLIAQIRENLSLDLAFRPVANADLSGEEPPRFRAEHDQLYVATLLRDLAGAPLLLAEVARPRDMVQEGRRVLYFAIGGATACVALVSLLVWWSFHRAVIIPLSMVTDHIVRMGQTGGLFEKLEVRRRDEFGVVAFEINRTQDRLVQLIHYDPLTRLPNRPHFLEKAEQMIHLAKRHGGQVAVLFIDLDDFKLVNDRLGHQAGDDVLVSFALHLSNCIRQTDALCRCGGDEFLVALTDLNNLEDVERICAKLIAMVGELSPREDAKVSASVGISLFPQDGATVAELIARADAAMYQSKTEKSHYTFYQVV